MPENQVILIQWLRQGAGKQVLAQLLEQSRQTDSPLKQWLLLLPTDKQEEFSALLKLAAEQRLAPAVKDTDTTLLQLHLLQPSGRELQLSVEKDPALGQIENLTIPLSGPSG